MAAKPGQVRNPNGRPKGRQFYNVVEECEKSGFNPIQALIDVARNEDIEWQFRVKAMAVLSEKSSQTFKAVEHKTDDAQHQAMLDTVNVVMAPLLEEHKRDY